MFSLMGETIALGVKHSNQDLGLLRKSFESNLISY